MRDALYHLERSKPATLQAQIREILMAAIAAGQLLAGEPVPSTRAMARRLGVSRNTVTLAYQELVSESFLLAFIPASNPCPAASSYPVVPLI